MASILLFLVPCFAAFIGGLLCTWVFTGQLIPMLNRHAILDMPNHRSSHTLPTPRGGGLAILATWAILIAIWSVITSIWLPMLAIPARLLWLVPAIAALAFISWRDDRTPLPWTLRIGVQILAIIIGMQALPNGLIFQGWLPQWLEIIGIVLFWLWFVNLTNFIDGIDGITGANGFVLGLGIAVVGMMTIDRSWLSPFGLLLAGSMLGFLLYNWHPARVFLGDVGSVPIGFISAFFLLTLALHGQWGAAVVLPLVPFLDATSTLVSRLVRGKKITEAHRDHAYQRGIIKGLTPPQVVMRIAIVNVCLLLLACASGIVDDVYFSMWMVEAGLLIAGIMLYFLQKKS